MPKLKNSGFSLIEMLLVVALIGLIGLMVFAGMGLTNQQKQADELRQGLVLLKRNIQSHYQGIGDYQGLNTASVIRLQFVTTASAPYFTDGTTIQHNLLGAVTVTRTPPTGFQIRLTNVPRFACVPLATTLTSDPSFIGLTMRGTTYTPATVNTAPDNCAATTTMDFAFR